MGGGAVGVGGEGGLELALGLGDEALAEVLAAELGVLIGLLGGREGGKAEGADLVELEGGLAEGGLGVGAADAFGRLEAVGGDAVGERSSGELEGGGDAGVELDGLGVGGAELESGVELVEGAWGVAAVEQGDGEVVVVVGVVGVCGEDTLEEGDGVLALTAGGDGLIVDYLGKRKAGGDEGEGSLGLGVLGGVEAGEAAVEAGLEGEAVVGGDLGEGGGGLIVLVGAIEGLAKGEERGGIVRGLGDGGLEALDALFGAGGVGAADVVLEGTEADASRGGEEGLLGDREVRVDLVGDLPGDGVLDVEEAGELAGVFEGRGEAEGVDLEDAGLDGDPAVLDGVVADDDVVGVKGLGDADGGGAGGPEVDGKAEVIEGELAVVAGDGEEAGGVKALIESVGEAVADPVEVGLAGAVLEGEHQHETAGDRLRGVGGGLRKGGPERQRRGREQANEEARTQDRAQMGHSEHRVEYSASGSGVLRRCVLPRRADLTYEAAEASPLAGDFAAACFLACRPAPG